MDAIVKNQPAELAKIIESALLALTKKAAQRNLPPKSTDDAAKPSELANPDDIIRGRAVKSLSDQEIQQLHAVFAAQYGEALETIGDDLRLVREVVEESMIRQFFELAVIQYTQMEQSEDFGVLGREQVIHSFCRLMLNIPPEQELTWDDRERFHQTIRQRQQALAGMTMQNFKQAQAGSQIYILGKKYGGGTRDQMNAILKTLGSSKKLFCSYTDGKRNYIFGNARLERQGNHEFYTFESEDMRSPYSPLPIIASTSQQSICFRKLSARMILHHKWGALLEHCPHLSAEPDEKMDFFLKKIALHKYCVTQRDDLNRIKNLIADEIIEGVLWHETGHTICHENIFTPLQNALVKMCNSHGIVSIIVLMELLADWAPEQADGRIGPIARLIQISHQDPVKAERMLWVYLSDNWFYGRETNPALKQQTDALLSLLVPFVNRRQVNFDRLAHAYDRILTGCLALLNHCVEAIIAPVNSAVFVINGQPTDFRDVDQRIRSILEHPVCRKEWSKNETELYPIFYWSNVISWVEQYAPDVMSAIKQLTEQQLSEINQTLLELSADKETALKHGNNLRQYLLSAFSFKG